MVGFDVPVPHLRDLEAAKASLARVVDLGANAVRLIVPLYQPHDASREPKLDQRPARGPTDADLLAVIDHARRLSLYTVLVPRVAYTRPRSGRRWADLSPPRWEPWWVAYARGVTHYARLAGRGGIDVLGLGDGIDAALDPRRHPNALNRWDALIADARDHFPGPVVVWAAARRAVVTADALGLDWIGIRPELRFEERDLQTPKRRDQSAARQWRRLAELAEDAVSGQGRPVALAGIGLPARADGWSRPEYAPFAPRIADEGVQAVSAVQSDALRGFLQAWQQYVPAPPGSGDADALSGVFFADWRLDRSGGPFDATHAMQGKPAEAILRRYFSGNHE
ncbi:MAG: hypothetical protein AAGE65_08865 [Planctomycetota bacterium]